MPTITYSFADACEKHVVLYALGAYKETNAVEDIKTIMAKVHNNVPQEQITSRVVFKQVASVFSGISAVTEFNATGYHTALFDEMLKIGIGRGLDEDDNIVFTAEEYGNNAIRLMLDYISRIAMGAVRKSGIYFQFVPGKPDPSILPLRG